MYVDQELVRIYKNIWKGQAIKSRVEFHCSYLLFGIWCIRLDVWSEIKFELDVI